MTDFTENLGFALQEDNENPDTWGQVLNEDVIELLEEALVGNSAGSIVDITASTNVTLTTTDGTVSDPSPTGTNKARCGILTLTGTLSNSIDITLPTAQGWYVINGSDPGFADGGFFVNFKTATSTNTVSINSGDIAFFMTDSTNLYPIIQTGTGGGAFLEAINNLTDVSNPSQAIGNLGLYPIGSLFFSTSATNPSSFLPGSWAAFGEGRVLIGVGTGTDDNAENRSFTGGEEGGEYNHTLTVAEMPSHSHSLQARNVTFTTGGTTALKDFTTADVTGSTGTAGGGQPHTNVQPYIGVYIWERTA